MRTATKIVFAQVEPHEIGKVYFGREDGCRCGCLGEYYYASDWHTQGSKERGYPVEDIEVSDEKIVEMCRILNAHSDKVELDADHEIIDLQLNGKVYTAYLR